MNEGYDANLFAQFVLLLWPLVCVALFARLKPHMAGAVIAIVGHLYLPERLNFDPPLLPPMNKQSLTALCLLIGSFVARPRPFQPIKTRVSDWLLLALVAGIFGTALTNGDALHYGPVTVQGTTLYDGFSDVVRDLLYVAAPLIAGRRLFQTREDLIDLFTVFVIGALTYVPLIAIELRLSPQLNNWIYGFHQHEFGQSARAGGWRPMVFVVHGLVVAKFLHEAVTASFLLQIVKRRLLGLNSALVGGFLFVVLALCNSVAALIYTILNNFVTPVRSNRWRLRLAMFLLFVVAAYPVLRLTGQIPTKAITDFVAQFSPDRAQSLGFRFTMEDQLLNHAMERPWFGWGGYARNFVYDRVTGEQLTTPDGQWIIQLVARGVVGAVCLFGLLFAPVFAARRRFLATRDPIEASLMVSAALLMAFSWFDLLPNSGPLPHLLLLTGAVHGVASRTELSARANIRSLIRAILTWRLLGSRAPRGRPI